MIKQGQLLKLRTSPIALASTLLLFFAAIIPPSSLRLWIFLCFTGIAPSLMLRRNWRISDAPAVAFATSLLIWSSAAYVCYAFTIPKALIWIPVGLSTIGSLYCLRKSAPTRIRVQRTDLIALCAAIILSVPAWVVLGANGFRVSSSGAMEFLAHHWVKLDTFYFFGLAQMAVERNKLPLECPNVAGIPNLYPPFLHVGFSAFSHISSRLAIESGLKVAIVAIPLTLLLIWHALFRFTRPVSNLWQEVTISAGLAAVVFIRPDLFAHFQSQVVAYVPGFLCLWLLAQIRSRKFFYACAIGTFFLTLLSHTITSLVVLVVFAAQLLVSFYDRRWHLRPAIMATSVFLLAVSYKKANDIPNPPEAAFHLRWSYEVLQQFRLSLLPWLIPVTATLVLAVHMLIFNTTSTRKVRVVAAAAVLLIFAGILVAANTLTYKDDFAQFFALFNLPRLWFFSMFLVIPVIAVKKVQTGLPALALLILPTFFWPSDVTRQFPQLITGPEIRFDADYLRVLARIRKETSPYAVFVSNVPHIALPAFTGRPEVAKLRQNYVAFGMISQADYQKLAAEYQTFLSAKTSVQDTREYIRKSRINYVLVDREAGPMLSPRLKAAGAFEEFSIGKYTLLRCPQS